MNGEMLVLEVGDDACDPKQAVAVANQMVGKNVAFMAGHFCSGSSIPASQVYAEEGIIQITPASTNRSTPTNVLVRAPTVFVVVMTSRVVLQVLHLRPNSAARTLL